MGAPDANRGVDPELVRAWLDARSISRRLPLSVEDSGAFRVDTGHADEQRRYVFPAPGAQVTAMARTIDAPNILIKLCAPQATLAALLSDGWSVRPPAWFMVRQGWMAVTPLDLSTGYRSLVDREGETFIARVLAPNGEIAASGRSVAHNGIFLFDQIATSENHRRRGLGRVIMGLLQDAGFVSGDTQVLTATPDGRALYSALGWQTLSDYCTGEFTG